MRSGADLLAGSDLVITSYGYLARAPWLCDGPWRLVVIDEAQAIKNPAAKQTRTVKQLKADARIALTGTPIENRLGDLWSIFDFINPGLLGSSKQFSSFVKKPRRPAAQSIRTPARAGAALYSEAAEDRQEHHRRSARQDRGEGVLPVEPQAGRALPAGGGGPGRPDSKIARASSAGASCSPS